MSLHFLVETKVLQANIGFIAIHHVIIAMANHLQTEVIINGNTMNRSVNIIDINVGEDPENKCKLACSLTC